MIPDEAGAALVDATGRLVAEIESHPDALIPVWLGLRLMEVRGALTALHALAT